MPLSKGFFQSKTVQGLLAMLLGQLWASLGWGISDAETLQITTWFVTGAGFAWGLYGRIATRGERLTVGSKSGLLSVLALTLAVCVTMGGCGIQAVSEMSAVEQARTYTDVLMKACDDVQDLYEAKWATATDEEKAELSPVGVKINVARAGISLAATAVVAWSEAEESGSAVAAAQSNYEALYAEAKDLLAAAQTAWGEVQADADTGVESATTEEAAEGSNVEAESATEATAPEEEK